jgi:hypothetical protein
MWLKEDMYVMLLCLSVVGEYAVYSSWKGELVGLV